mmetsp:Transcript_6748/g.11867  ORF Transcript_6748/g.11867 Transcript_6748/m.11867 type:complete len:207 (-) Transcript_6748:87-707(-)
MPTANIHSSSEVRAITPSNTPIMPGVSLTPVPHVRSTPSICGSVPTPSPQLPPMHPQPTTYLDRGTPSPFNYTSFGSSGANSVPLPVQHQHQHQQNHHQHSPQQHHHHQHHQHQHLHQHHQHLHQHHHSMHSHQHQPLGMRSESCSPPLFLGGGAFSTFSAATANDSSTLTAYTTEPEDEDDDHHDVDDAHFQSLLSNILTDIDEK